MPTVTVHIPNLNIPNFELNAWCFYSLFFLFKSSLLLFLITSSQIRWHYLLSLPLLISFYCNSLLQKNNLILKIYHATPNDAVVSPSPAPCSKLCGIFFLMSATLTGCCCVVFSIRRQGSCRIDKTTNKMLTYLQDEAEVSWGLVFAFKVFAEVDI